MKKLKKIAQEIENSLSNYNKLSQVLAFLRAGAFIHQTHHWQTRGMNYYSDHLLFQRLYDESSEFIDSIAEKAVGLGYVDLVDPLGQIILIHKILSSIYNQDSTLSPDDMVLASLEIEKKIIDFIKKTIESLNSNNLLTHGLSNLLEDIADKHESFVYLLNQRSS